MRVRLAKKILFSNRAWCYSAVQLAQANKRMQRRFWRARLRVAADPKDQRKHREWLGRKPGKARGKKWFGRRGRANIWRIDRGLDVRW